MPAYLRSASALLLEYGMGASESSEPLSCSVGGSGVRPRPSTSCLAGGSAGSGVKPSASPRAANGCLFGSADDDAAADDDDDAAAAAAGDDDRLALGMKAPNPLPGSSSSFSRACSRLLAISSPIRFIPPHAKANGTPTPIIAA